MGKFTDGTSFYSKNTLMSWKKEKLVEHIDCLYRNYESNLLTMEQMYQNFIMCNDILSKDKSSCCKKCNSSNFDHAKGESNDKHL